VSGAFTETTFMTQIFKSFKAAANLYPKKQVVIVEIITV